MPTDGALVRQRHPVYYFDMVEFEVRGCYPTQFLCSYLWKYICHKVQGTLFNVPKNRFLAINPNFFERFEDKAILGEEESSKPHPIELQGITKASFEGLLLVMYPLYVV